MPHVHVNDIRLYYEIHGDKEPLILVTGFTQHSLAWGSIIPTLAKEFQVITVDNRGAGQSDTPDSSYSIEIFAQDIVGLMNELGIESAHFIGQSMGTLIIQKLCISHPDRVRKGVLCAPFAKLPAIARHNLKSQLKILSHGVDPALLHELNAAWLLSEPFLSNPANVERFVNESRKNPYPQSPSGLLGQANALLEADLLEEIEKIPHKILLLVGERDIDTPPYCAEFICKQIRSCTMHMFKDMGHLFVYEIPDKTVKRAMDFILQD